MTTQQVGLFQLRKSHDQIKRQQVITSGVEEVRGQIDKIVPGSRGRQGSGGIAEGGDAAAVGDVDHEAAAVEPGSAGHAVRPRFVAGLHREIHEQRLQQRLAQVLGGDFCVAPGKREHLDGLVGAPRQRPGTDQPRGGRAEQHVAVGQLQVQRREMLAGVDRRPCLADQDRPDKRNGLAIGEKDRDPALAGEPVVQVTRQSRLVDFGKRAFGGPALQPPVIVQRGKLARKGLDGIAHLAIDRLLHEPLEGTAAELNALQHAGDKRLVIFRLAVVAIGQPKVAVQACVGGVHEKSLQLAQADGGDWRSAAATSTGDAGTDEIGGSLTPCFCTSASTARPKRDLSGLPRHLQRQQAIALAVVHLHIVLGIRRLAQVPRIATGQRHRGDSRMAPP